MHIHLQPQAEVTIFGSGGGFCHITSAPSTDTRVRLEDAGSANISNVGTVEVSGNWDLRVTGQINFLVLNKAKKVLVEDAKVYRLVIGSVDHLELKNSLVEEERKL